MDLPAALVFCGFALLDVAICFVVDAVPGTILATVVLSFCCSPETIGCEPEFVVVSGV
jgi:hypothetical protein